MRRREQYYVDPVWYCMVKGSIPSMLGRLKNLQGLRLSNNQLTALGGVEEAPQWLLDQFERLQSKVSDFELRGNPWENPPEAVVENGYTALKTYYSDVRMAFKKNADVITRKLLKVVLVGSSGVGKTRYLSRFYDCTGQIDYYGMHQVFLTGRTLFLLVWDITRCSVLSENLDKEISKMIIRWLYALQSQAPGSTVLLVANKCDKEINDATEIARTVEKRVKSILQKWEARQRADCTSCTDGYSHRSFHSNARKNRTEINLLEDFSLISCDNFDGIPALIERVSRQTKASMVVPPAWALALEFINALRCKRSPVAAALEYLQLPVNKENDNGDLLGSFITKEKLTALWRNVVERAEKTLRTTKDGVSRLRQDVETASRKSTTGDEAALTNSDNALKGALWISEFAGHVIFVGDGGGIFLDVVWLSELLKPILNHKLKHLYLPTMRLCTMRDDLVEDKILRWEFARYVWMDVLPYSSLQSGEQVAHALYNTLIKLGVILPLGTTTYATNEGITLPSRETCHRPTQPPDMLVIMRLCETLRKDQQRLLMYTLDQLKGVAEVSLQWEFDSAGSPYGFFERLIASCQRIGVVERSLCWRHGVLFRSHEVIRRSGQNARLFTMLIRYDSTHDTVDNISAHILTVRMIGPLKSPIVWAALRYVASAVIMLSKKWPGLILKGSSVSSGHSAVSPTVYLTPPDKACIGSPLISMAAQGVCHREVDGVLRLVTMHLGVVVDITEDPMEALKDNIIRDMFNLWWPYAWQTTIGLCSLALALLGGIAAGVFKGKPALWQASLTVMIILILAAVAISVVFYQNARRVLDDSVKPSAVSPSNDTCDDV